MSQTIKAEVRQVGKSHSRGSVRSHSVDVDRPTAKGGSDQGPMGGELLLLGLGGCFMSNLLAAISARESRISDVEVDVEAVLDETPTRMTRFTLRVRGRGEDRSDLEKLATIAERGCLVTNTLRGGSSIEVVVEPGPG